MPKLIDLTGKTFGQLTVTGKAPSRNNHVYWYCKCTCGTENYEVQGSHLKDGRTSRCPKCRQENRTKNKTYPEKKCLICGQNFIPNSPKRKYCYECSPSFSQEERASAITAIRHAIKKQLVKYKGGKCEVCGYNKCIGALQFHHLDSFQKDFELSTRYNGGNFDMKSLYQEADKCQLLCANCHAEKHFYQ